MHLHRYFELKTKTVSLKYCFQFPHFLKYSKYQARKQNVHVLWLLKRVCDAL